MITVPEDNDRDERLAVFKDTFEKLQEKVDNVEGQLEELEESGEADRQPVKHQKAVAKVNEINEQIETLKDALQEVEDGDGDR